MTAIVFFSAWALWILGNLALMVFARPDVACFNGFRVHVPARYLERLTVVEFLAIYAHEEGHRHHWHIWGNFARVCFFMRASRHRRLLQEFEADDYAAMEVDPRAMASALRKLSCHPIDFERATRLETLADSFYYEMKAEGENYGLV